mgnify:CR=1 FL=1
MRKLVLLMVVAICVMGLTFTGEAIAQRGRGGWSRSPYGRIYNPATVETISGEVVSVDLFTLGIGLWTGVHLMVKTESETISVHLGPQWYIENQEIEFEPGDEIEVTGSRVVYAGGPAIIAAQVMKGDWVLILRNDNGFPLWSGWRRVP